MLKDEEGITGAGRRGKVVGATMPVAGLAGGTLAAVEIANGQWKKPKSSGQRQKPYN